MYLDGYTPQTCNLQDSQECRLMLFLILMQSAVQQCLLDSTCTLMVTLSKLATYMRFKNVAQCMRLCVCALYAVMEV